MVVGKWKKRVKCNVACGKRCRFAVGCNGENGVAGLECLIGVLLVLAQSRTSCRSARVVYTPEWSRLEDEFTVAGRRKRSSSISVMSCSTQRNGRCGSYLLSLRARDEAPPAKGGWCRKDQNLRHRFYLFYQVKTSQPWTLCTLIFPISANLLHEFALASTDYEVICAVAPRLVAASLLHSLSSSSLSCQRDEADQNCVNTSSVGRATI